MSVKTLMQGTKVDKNEDSPGENEKKEIPSSFKVALTPFKEIIF